MKTTEPSRRWNRDAAIGAVLIAAAVSIPLFVTDPAILDLQINTAYFLLLAGSWNLLAGFTGQFSFAQVALSLIGAYASIFATDVLGLPVWATIPVAGLVSAAAGVLLGLACLRLRGVYLSLITFAFAGAFVAWTSAAVEVTGGSQGKIAEVFFMSSGLTGYAWLATGLVIAYFVAQSLLLRSRWGIKAMATRDREEIAFGIGVATRVIKIQAFAFSSLWAGIAGSLYAGYVGVVDPSLGLLSNMGLVVAMVVVGGLGRRFGPIVGVVVLQLISHQVEGFGAQYTVLIFASILLVVMLVARNGILGIASDLITRVKSSRVAPELQLPPSDRREPPTRVRVPT